jgi:thymidylate synthase (FAD)
LKTEIVVTANLREWRHIFNLRCASSAHPQIRQIMLPMLASFHERIPVVFDDLYKTFQEDIAKW